MFDFSYDREAVMKQLGLEASDQAFKDQILERIDALLEQNMSRRIALELSDEELLHFEKLSDDKDATIKWLNERFPNHQQLYKEELAAIVEQAKDLLDAQA